jgi:hypothetical protein
MKALSLLVILAMTSVSISSFANRLSDDPVKIDHCYHWLKEGAQGILKQKYIWANAHQGELTFYGSGGVAGDGLYCAKTPVSSSNYGDRVVRIEFVADLVLWNKLTDKYYIGGVEVSAKEATVKGVDIVLYTAAPPGNRDSWYVIKNTAAVVEWEANGSRLTNDLSNAKADGLNPSGTLSLMDTESKAGIKTAYYNGNARLSLDKLMQDPAAMAKIDSVALVRMFIRESKNQ